MILLIMLSLSLSIYIYICVYTHHVTMYCMYVICMWMLLFPQPPPYAVEQVFYMGILL